MAITSYPFDNQDTTESQYSKLFRELQDSGVVDGFTGTAFQPFGDSTGMNVKLRAGMAIVRGHVINSDAVFTVTLPAADSAARVDRIVLRLDPTANSITPTYIKGVVGQGVPAMTQTDTGLYDLPIATVNVAGSAPNVGPTDVTDVRPFVGKRVGVANTTNRPTAPRAYDVNIAPDKGGRLETYDPTGNWLTARGTTTYCTSTTRPTAPRDGEMIFETDTKAFGFYDAATPGWHMWDTINQSFTPVYASAGGAPALGNGSLVGKYRRMGRLCWLKIEFIVGTTTNAGTGTCWFILPAALGASGGEQWIPAKIFTAANSQNYFGTCWLAGNTASPYAPQSISVTSILQVSSCNAAATPGTGTPTVSGALSLAASSNMFIEGVYELATG